MLYGPYMGFGEKILFTTLKWLTFCLLHKSALTRVHGQINSLQMIYRFYRLNQLITLLWLSDAHNLWK